MWYELYSWLESITGKDYDYSDELKELDSVEVFINPYIWSIDFDKIVDALVESINIITTYSDEIPSTLPTDSELKAELVSTTMDALTNTIEHIKNKLDIHIDSPSSFDDLINVKTALCGLIILLVDYDIDMIHKNDSLSELNDECNNAIVDILNITDDDLYILQTNIQTIRQEYYLEQDKNNDDE